MFAQILPDMENRLIILRKYYTLFRDRKKNVLFDLFLAMTVLGIVAALSLPPVFTIRYS